MSKQIKIRITDSDGGNEEIASFEIGDGDWGVLEDFARYAAELDRNSLVRDGIPCSVSLNWSETEGLRVDAKIPPDEATDAMLVKLRPFILKNEPTFLPKVRSILERASDSPRVGQLLKTVRKFFSGERLQSTFVAGATSTNYPQGVIVNSEEMLDLWLNGYRFHKEKEKQRIFEAMHGLMPVDSSIALLLLMVSDKVRAILLVRSIIAVLQGQVDSISAPIVREAPRKYRAFLHASLVQVSLFELDEQVRPLPVEGPCFERVVDLTHLGPASFHQFLHPVGQLWMHGKIHPEIGDHHVYFRVAKGFQVGAGEPSAHGMDIIATIKVVAFITEDPVSEARRKPAQALLAHMRQRTGRGQRVLRAVETPEAMAAILESESDQIVEWITVPRVAYQFAYWPISEQATERLHRIVSEGRSPTFEEVEGTDLSQAWEIYSQPTSPGPLK